MAVHEIESSRKPELTDHDGQHVSTQIKNTFGLDVGVKVTQIFQIEGLPSEEQALGIAKTITDPVLSDLKVGRQSATAVAFVDGINVQIINGIPSVEVGLKPEMTDNEAEDILTIANLLSIPVEAAHINKRYTFTGVTAPQAGEIARRLLVNPNIEETAYTTPDTLKVDNEPGKSNTINLIEANDDQLMEFSKDKLFLDLYVMQAIQDHFRKLERNPSDVELEHIAAAWSEHCKHGTFNSEIEFEGENIGTLMEMIVAATNGTSGELVATKFKDNSGGIFFYEGMVVIIKVETHNGPSGIDPYAGAATGIGGVDRDIIATGLGGKIIANIYVFVVAPPDMSEDKLPPKIIKPDNMLRGLVKGVESYGNPMGVPTVNGSVTFNENFAAKPTVLVGGIGILPEKDAQKGEARPGDRVYAIGGRTGRDGIHGATFSSAEMTDRTIRVNSSAVQMGNPIEEKKFQDAILEARDQGLIVALTDCGAAGFGSAIGEIASHTGVEVDISKAPLKYKGLSPYEIWISESQERMVLAIDPKNAEAFEKVCRKYGVEATDLGQFTDTNRLVVNHNNENVIDLDYDFLNNGLPKRKIKASYKKPVFEEPDLPVPTDWVDEYKKIMGHLDISSKKQIIDQFDATVQGNTALPPLSGVNYDMPNDASVITPMPGKNYGVVLTHGINPLLNRIDPTNGAKWAAAEALTNLIAAGGNIRETALCVNYIEPKLDDEQKMGSLVLQVKAVSEFVRRMGTPVVSGKDSLSSTYDWGPDYDHKKTHVDPVVNVATLGKIEDASKTNTGDFKKVGSTVVLVGKPDYKMGGSIYYANHNIVGNEVPRINEDDLLKVGDSIFAATGKREILSARGVKKGGIAAAVAKMCIGGDCGVELDIDNTVRPDFYLFNESADTLLVEVESPEKAAELFGDLPYKIVGKTVNGKNISVKHNSRDLFSVGLDELKEVWEKPMEKVFA